MTLLQLLVLALVQGITEFLPISSSGHLILIPLLADWPDQGLALDVAVHVGTLLAVMLYFWRDMIAMLLGLLNLLRGRRTDGARLVAMILVATLPVLIAGFLLQRAGMMQELRSVLVIGWATLVFGILLWLADWLGMTIRRVEHMSLGAALFIGCAQVLALVPGTSRAGVTMTAARIMGFERDDTARFSMLLSIPTILAAGALAGLDLAESGDSQLGFSAILAALLAFGAALLSIWGLMWWLRRATYAPFVVYRVLLGAGLLAWGYGLL
ncbi:undecaprenyl-diphosphate phosphatase [Marinibaculum pumilum]|uniref:Undecaprenyl-diphosphatase n=1 Tax=Marinibaculum pumilum TaxID=1766165 RepID=A0ABV7L7A2_9PROT